MLTPSASDPREWRFQEHVVKALGLLGDTRAVEPLLALVNPRATAKEERSFQFEILQALAALKDRRALEPLRSHLEFANGSLYTALVQVLSELDVTPV